MVRFDHSRLSAQTALYHIRIDGSLCQEIHCSDFLCFFLKYTDEFLTDDLPLLLRLCHACQLV